MFKNFIKRIIIFSAFISAISYFLYHFFIPQFYLRIFPFLIIFFIATSIIVHFILTNAGKQQVRRFSTFYLGSISIKLFLYIIFITIYVVIDKSTAVPFLLTFLILYALFTFFETYSLMNDLKNQTQIDNKLL
jgi:hypothetical protein